MRRWLFVISVLVCSCSPRLTMVESRDSTVTTVTNGFRDTTIQVPVPSERVTAVTSLDSAFRLQTTITEVIIKPVDNHLFEVALQHRKGAFIPAVVQIPTQQVTTVTTQLRRETVVKEVNVLHWWQTALIWTGVAGIVLVIGKVVWKIWGSKFSALLKLIK